MFTETNRYIIVLPIFHVPVYIFFPSEFLFFLLHFDVTIDFIYINLSSHPSPFIPRYTALQLRINNYENDNNFFTTSVFMICRKGDWLSRERSSMRQRVTTRTLYLLILHTSEVCNI